MFLTKKGLWKIVLMTLCYFVIGSVSIGAGVIFTFLGISSDILFVLGLICYVFCPIVIACGRYAEGKGKLINLGNKLVRKELKPNEFLKEYHKKRNSPDLVVNKPSPDVLQLVALAYDTLGDKDNCLAVIDEMISISKKKDIMFLKLIKCSFMFSYNMIDEAEAIFSKARSSKQNIMCQALTEAIFKSDRAIAIGDYKTAEVYALKSLSQKFPKLDNLSKLVLNYKLASVYEKLEDFEKAMQYYEYCVENGGETALKETARSALLRIK